MVRSVEGSDMSLVWGNRGAMSVLGLVVSLLVLVTACGSDVEPLSEEESTWCARYQSPQRLIERGETLGIDMEAVFDGARQAMDEVDAAGGDTEAQFAAVDTFLRTDAGYGEVCRSLYEEADH